MGAINYGRSKYITMGERIAYLSDYEPDKESIMDEMEEFGGYIREDITEEDYNEYLTQYIYQAYEDDKVNAECYINQEDFQQYHVEIKPGYYEGYYLDIFDNYIYFDDEQERQEAYKEIERIRLILIEIAGSGFCCVYPGWCTKELDYRETLSAIDKAIEEMKEDVKNKPLYDEYYKEA